ncbi:hypothetical protein GQF61_07480 [Sphingobacterium sp. DK4209]|uniref:Heparinase II C-terminal domain-containing protein n=1 Tax=Sphingobacterium zhuxiongii TaxID=2662364 RepID=A0A5Q0QEC4_9SPHI|nr:MULTISPECIES: hypothetical protein [unclassified Sphingobacterium]MVZ65695.1 hypothetical protein [Sphingobacterium sp. DK4209]QGA27893.1 hypothetical protein GFH32_16870 [Sphingobacterium sp. dk4302]
MSINDKTSEVIADERLTSKTGITLKPNITASINAERAESDVHFTIKTPTSGYYTIYSYAVTDAEGAQLMKKAKTKFESMYMRIQFGNKRGTKRVIYVPWDRPLQHTGIFDLAEGEQDVMIWLPRGVRLEYLQIGKYAAPKVPAAAAAYKPSIIPPNSHPRLWVNQETLPIVRKNLERPEHHDTWEKLKKEALTPFKLDFDPNEEMPYNVDLEKATELKAFYYLMSGDKMIGREAIELTKAYLSHVEFGNILDITRELGRAIYTASLVYDWTYDLLSTEEKSKMIKDLMRLSMDMEIGWPPFRMKILNGHGNEAMVNRDFLAMSMAIYDEDPIPYQYISYHILEELVPMRRFEYQSPRHNQGISYASYRFAWEMHAAWLFYRMSGKKVFDENLSGMPAYFMYMRTPAGDMLRDGDGFAAGKPGEDFYWKSPQVMFLMANYGKDPIVKGEFLRHGNLNNPTLFLLLNDPDFKAEPSLSSLPLTKDFGPILGSMVTRTGWNIGPDSDDVVAEIKGGGYHFGNHQHADAGAIQLYYRGFQLGDIGVYRFYGTPFDLGFNKRSASHSMMLAVDTTERFYRSTANDGGARFNQRAPSSKEEVQTDPWFNNGQVIATSIGPDKKIPLYSYFSANLTGAYSDKMTNYIRQFCFINTGRKDVPAVIVLTDQMETKNSTVDKYWQIASINKPELTADGFILQNSLNGRNGRTHVQILAPHSSAYDIKVLSDSMTTNIFGTQLEAPDTPYPEGKGHRTLVSYKAKEQQNHFLSVFQVCEGVNKPLNLSTNLSGGVNIIHIGEDLIVATAGKEIKQSFEFTITNKEKNSVILTGLKAGKWKVSRGKRAIAVKDISTKEQTAYLSIEKAGKYTVSPL